MSGLFKEKKEELPGPKLLESDREKRAKEILARFSEFGADIPKPGAPLDLPVVAPDEPYEAAIPGLIESFIGRETPEVTSSAIQNIIQTLTGGFDPETSPRYAALRRGVLKESGEAKTRLKQGAQFAGQFRSRAAVGQERKLEEETFATLSGIMAELADKERQRQLAVLPYAQAFGAGEEAFPLRSLAAINQFSMFPRRQATVEAEREEVLRQKAEAKEPLTIAQFLASPQNYQYYQPQFTTKKSPFEKYVMPAAKIALAMYTAGASGAQMTPYGPAATWSPH